MEQATIEPNIRPLRRSYPERGGIVDAIGPLSGRNRVAAAFYDGPGWLRFRRWEHAFLALQGGQRRARRPILNILKHRTTARVLEVGVGEGDNLPFLSVGEVHGVDLARSRLEVCLGRFPEMEGRLSWAEAERLPHEDASFDACLCVGGFNYFDDPAGAIREMRRVTRPGGLLVIADEVPWLVRCGIGHLIGLPRLDAAWLRLIGLDREFAEIAIGLAIDLDDLFPSSEGWRRVSIWHGLGYCAVGHS